MNKQIIVGGAAGLLFIAGGFLFWQNQQLKSAPPIITLPASNSALPATMKEKNAETVEIVDFGFSKTAITITKGTTVNFVNTGKYGHSATADDGSFDTGIIAAGNEKTVIFQTAGTFTYHCTPHPTMRAQITVTE